MSRVAERFSAAAGGPPLSDLSAADARELAVVLAAVDGFDDLPGKWQAALLRSEAARAGDATAATGGCCRHGHAA